VLKFLFRSGCSYVQTGLKTRILGTEFLLPPPPPPLTVPSKIEGVLTSPETHSSPLNTPAVQMQSSDKQGTTKEVLGAMLSGKMNN